MRKLFIIFFIANLFFPKLFCMEKQKQYVTQKKLNEIPTELSGELNLNQEINTKPKFLLEKDNKQYFAVPSGLVAFIKLNTNQQLQQNLLEQNYLLQQNELQINQNKKVPLFGERSIQKPKNKKQELPKKETVLKKRKSSTDINESHKKKSKTDTGIENNSSKKNGETSQSKEKKIKFSKKKCALCSIFFEKRETKEKYKECKHRFHTSCILNLIQKEELTEKTKCPICQKNKKIKKERENTPPLPTPKITETRVIIQNKPESQDFFNNTLNLCEEPLNQNLLQNLNQSQETDQDKDNEPDNEINFYSFCNPEFPEDLQIPDISPENPIPTLDDDPLNFDPLDNTFTDNTYNTDTLPDPF